MNKPIIKSLIIIGIMILSIGIGYFLGALIGYQRIVPRAIQQEFIRRTTETPLPSESQISNPFIFRPSSPIPETSIK